MTAGLNLYGGNDFNSSIPTELGNLVNFEYRFGLVDNTQLDSTIPTEFGNMVKMTSDFWLHKNSLHSTIPTELGKLVKLSGDLVLHTNQMTGGKTERWGRGSGALALRARARAHTCARAHVGVCACGRVGVWACARVRVRLYVRTRARARLCVRGGRPSTHRFIMSDLLRRTPCTRVTFIYILPHPSPRSAPKRARDAQWHRA